jgi:hypothetical protein
MPRPMYMILKVNKVVNEFSQNFVMLADISYIIQTLKSTGVAVQKYRFITDTLQRAFT